MGYTRVQAESFAFLRLFAIDPVTAKDWLDPVTGQSKQFYSKNHSRIVEIIREFGLYEHYERGSEMALHSRIGGVSLGILQGDKSKEAVEKTVNLVYQEVKDPVVLFFWFCLYLQFHEKIIKLLPTILPELKGTEIGELRIEGFSALMEGLWKTVRPLHRQWQREGQPI